MLGERVKELRKALNSLITILKHEINLDLWMITRVVDDDWIMLAISENSYGVNVNDVKVWSESVCCNMVEKKGPNIVPCLSMVPAYANAPIAHQLNFKSYVGYPLKSEDGELLGTLCAIDPNIQDVTFEKQRSLIEEFVIVVQTMLRSNMEINRLNSLAKSPLLQGQSNINNDSEGLGMLNQEAFYDIAKQQKARLDNVASPLSIVLIDILRFPSSFDDTVDEFEALLSAKTSLMKLLRETDVAFKLQGHRFAALMIDTDSKMLTLQVVNIIKVLQARGFKVSVGAHVCKQQETIDDAFKKAQERRFA